MTTATPQPTLSFPRATFAKLSPHPYLLAHLQPASANDPALRANGRSQTQFRTPHINTGSLTHAEGSAVVRIGDTAVVCGVRGEILLASNVSSFRVDKSSSPGSRPEHNEAKELDLLVPNIELATGCSPAFMPGQPPSTLAQSLSTRIYSLLHSSRLVDDADLRIWYQPEKVSNQEEDTTMGDDAEEVDEAVPEIKAFWTLYIDLLFISLNGNPFDAAWAAVIAALKDVRLPKASWDPDLQTVVCDDSIAESKKLTLRGMPIATTAVVFRAKEQLHKDSKHWILFDPDTFEEGLCDETVTVVVDCTDGPKTKVLGISKSGGAIIGKSEMSDIVGLAEKRWAEFNGLLKG
ncbi:exoribonuclease family protein [Xylogone sp. PMI_703]|nr:exoribonuclease family protein [Xylogone sp. PMI_703]